VNGRSLASGAITTRGVPSSLHHPTLHLICCVRLCDCAGKERVAAPRLVAKGSIVRLLVSTDTRSGDRDCHVTLMNSKPSHNKSVFS
jgi:hypothetical protein